MARTAAPANDHGGGGRGFFFPPEIQERGKATLEQELLALDNQVLAQELLDELGAAISRGRVAYPVRYLRALIGKARSGEFIPEHAHHYAKGRSARLEAAARAQAEREARAVHKPASKEAARPHLEAMRAIVRRKTR